MKFREYMTEGWRQGSPNKSFLEMPGYTIEVRGIGGGEFQWRAFATEDNKKYIEGYVIKGGKEKTKELAQKKAEQEVKRLPK